MAEHELNKIVDDDGEVFNLRDSTKQPVSDRVTSWGSTPSDTKYPSEKLVKDSLDAKVDFQYNDSSIGVSSPASECKAFFGDDTINPAKRVKLVYNDKGNENTIIFSRANSKRYGTILKYGYTDRYLYLLRFKNKIWQSEDWEKIYAGYADSANYATSAGSAGSVKERDVAWSGTFRTTKSPIETFTKQNSFFYPKPSAVKVEYSNNRTAETPTWTDYGLTDTQKQSLFSGNEGAMSIYCGAKQHVHPGYTGIAPYKDLSNDNVADQGLRITIACRSLSNRSADTDNWIYCYLRGILLYMSTQSAGGGAHCVVEKQNGTQYKADSSEWVTLGDYKIQGDPEWNSIPFDGAFGGGWTQTSNYSWVIRFTIWSDQLSATPNSGQTGCLMISAIAGINHIVWGATNPVQRTGLPFSYSYDGTMTLMKPLPIASGGTGKTTAKAAEYNLTTGKSEISDTTSGDDRVVFEQASPSESNGVTRGFRKLSTIWTWIKGLLSSESGVNISGSSASCTGNAATATALASGSADRAKLDGIAAGAEVNVQSDWNQATTTADDYIKNKPTIPAAVRVKGDAESSYRTGDVNLTPANIGLTDAAIRGKISAGTDLSYDSSTGVMKVDTTGTATGNYAFASGAATTASGNYSHAEGYSATASSTSAHAEGSRTVASTPAAHAEGHRTTASGISAHAEGYRDDGDEFAGFSVASGFGSHIEGIDTKASDDASHAEGYLTESSGPHAHAEGESTVASGKDSHAEGLWSNASGLNSHAENSSFAYGENAHSEGYGQSSWGAAGVASHTEGSAAFAYGMSAHAEGGGTNALGKDSHAEGLGGGYRPVAITLTADHVAETSTFTGSTEGLSVGMYLLWKDDAHLTQQVSKITWIGNGTFGTQAAFDSAIPAGTVVYAVDRGVAAGTASHVEGFGTSAVGTYAHAEGYLTKAIGEASHAEGQGTEARTGGMHAAGMYPATKEGFARVTGWGSAASPKDIERLGTQGTLWVSGHFYGATPLKVVPGQTTYDEIYEAWSEQRPFVIEVSMLTHMAHAIYAPAIIRAVPLDQAMDHWEFHFKVEYPYNYRASFYAGGQEPYKVSIYYLAINEQQGWGKLVSGTNEWASLSDSRWYSVPVEYAALAETATEAQNAAASSPLANAINGKSDVGHKHPISDLTMGILPASLGGTGYNNLSDACSATLKAVTLGTDPTMYADDEIIGSNHTSGTTDTSKFVRRKASTMKAYVLNGGTMTGQFTNSYQGYGYQASHGTSNKYVGFEAYREDTQVGVSLEVGSNGKVHGVYSSKLGTWIISERDDNKIHIYNDRLIINSAGALRGSDGVVVITNAAENAGGVLSAGALRQTSFISVSGEFEVKNTDAAVRGLGQLYFYRNTNATTAILAKWHVNSTSTYATGYIQPGCTGVFQLTNDTNNYFTRLS